MLIAIVNWPPQSDILDIAMKAELCLRLSPDFTRVIFAEQFSADFTIKWNAMCLEAAIANRPANATNAVKEEVDFSGPCKI